MNKKAIILLSGGLDSLVCLDIAKKRLFELYALFFNYSQKAYLEEKDAVRNICSYYKIEYKEINIPFLSELSDNALVNDKVNNFDSLESVWIPNRNGLFLNIAACYCDKMKIDRSGIYYIIGIVKTHCVGVYTPMRINCRVTGTHCRCSRDLIPTAGSCKPSVKCIPCSGWSGQRSILSAII